MYLKMPGCHFGPDSMLPSLIAGLCHYRYLQEVNLSGNTLTSCMQKLIDSTSDCAFQNLEKLDLHSTKLSDEDVTHLAEMINSTNSTKSGAKWPD